ncbi:HERV-H LTR-associating protein 1 [Tamandua tetradactyla]|uniref:HERV-H LTR-associating protein 1 n=1 Tax=Tamandua tetradactyla TaxID=48850 RepID=UPI00405485FE
MVLPPLARVPVEQSTQQSAMTVHYKQEINFCCCTINEIVDQRITDMAGFLPHASPVRLCMVLACLLSLWDAVSSIKGEAKKENGMAFLPAAASENKEVKKEKESAFLVATELPARSVDLSALNLTELVNGMLSRALKDGKKFFSLFSITSYSSFAFHKFSVAVYNISRLKRVDPASFPTRHCYCLNNRTNDLSDFTALLVEIIGNSTSYLTEIFKSTSILSVRQTNGSDCIFICVMTGKAGRNLSDFWETAEKSPVIDYTFTSSMSSVLATCQGGKWGLKSSLGSARHLQAALTHPGKGTLWPALSSQCPPSTMEAFPGEGDETKHLDLPLLFLTGHRGLLGASSRCLNYQEGGQCALGASRQVLGPDQRESRAGLPGNLRPQHRPLHSPGDLRGLVPGPPPAHRRNHDSPGQSLKWSLAPGAPDPADRAAAMRLCSVVRVRGCSQGPSAGGVTLTLSRGRFPMHPPCRVVAAAATCSSLSHTARASGQALFLNALARGFTTDLGRRGEDQWHGPLLGSHFPPGATAAPPLPPGTDTPGTQTPRPTNAAAPKYPQTGDPAAAGPSVPREQPALLPGLHRVSGCSQLLHHEGPLPAPRLVLAAQKLSPCLMELCRFFQQCLCVAPQATTRAAAVRYCLEYYSWFLKNATYICQRLNRVSHSHTLKQKCLENICKSI